MFKIALCQIKVEDDKYKNLNKAISYIKEAKENKADLVCFGEMFICPYRKSLFKSYAQEEKNSYILNELSIAAKENNIYIVAGSIPEKENDKYYNTSYVFDKQGNIIAKHRKVHLYDVEIDGKITNKESDIFSYGNNITVFDTQYCKIGLSICYDIRFPEIFRIMEQKGAKLIIIPAAFNTITGPMHWDILLKSRAIDNQVYIAGVSCARDCKESYVVYGHSKVIDPLGNTVGSLDEKEGILYSDINLDYISKVRKQLPILNHKRSDLYETKIK
ncbi:Predicted amidohydrolase [Alkalithermobacter thermoalcaliphilus JW-YL-7 = DSM 7308]|uniref:Nitrilase/cyanide hydratase and apolipoprotein N-acyltransferase n=1 Tax=Alkalithermobacter thermoalcaliphilus JW-YL-7 = DSM 7308 TaxID=1121328 RepID=A0A150FT36_CLOPD|nr:Nitrilase/cyanide hydratase and apolipoprotein N-acyltransferase [[Clostridium] paradoxum JW-YL-7 = DSM 7308]SHK37413.1 Predicted amidohydrolase [[Clostridium] paradoxum JW-YL-7 = DSM 7308]